MTSFIGYLVLAWLTGYGCGLIFRATKQWLEQIGRY